MEQELTNTLEFDDDEEQLVHEWRTSQLHRLGVPRLLAEAFAADVDWHKVAELVRCGCDPLLAVEIVR